MFIAKSLEEKSLPEWRLVRSLSLRRDASQMSPLPVLPVNQGRVLRDPVVPDNDGAGLPLDAGLEIGAVREVIVEELEEGV